ncbi:thiol-disulfide oxidoreductase DCC family protein [Nitrospira sp. Nam74]
MSSNSPGDTLSVMEQPSAQHDRQRGESERLLIYDAQCRLCVTAKEGVERLGNDLNVRWVPYQSDEARDRLGAQYRAGRPDVAFLVDRDGTIKKGLDAFLPLLPGLRGGRMLQALMRIPFLRPLAYLIYRAIARYRYRWFGSVDCDCKP